MALTVGELRAFLTIDDRSVQPALRRAEQALRQTGQRIGDDADRAGRDAGQALGDGVADGARTGLNGLRHTAARAGQQAGDDLGDGLADRTAAGADNAVDQAGSRLERLKTVAAGIAIGAGVAAGAVLVSGITEAIDQGRITARMTAGLSATPEQAKRYGQAAGVLFKNAVVENFQEGAATIEAIARGGLVPPDATVAQIARIGTSVSDLATKYGEETSRVTRAAKKLLVTGLAKTSTEAFDLIAKALDTSVNQGEDFLDTLNEYSVQFKRVGLDGKTSIGLISQAINKGARDSDQVADAIGQFGERALAGGTAVTEAFESIGLDADQVVAKLRKGGKDGREALQMTTDALRDTGDATTRLNAAAALFGDPGNVMGDALLALDPASAAASSGMDKAAGSSKNLGKELRNNLGSKIDAFKNTIQQSLVDVLNGPVYSALSRTKNTLGHLWDDAGKGSTEGADRIVAFFGLVAQRMGVKILELVPKAAYYLGVAGERIAQFIQQNPEQALKISLIAAAVGAGLMMLPVIIGGTILAAGTMVVVRFVTSMVDGLNRELTKLGTAAGTWFGGLWSRYISGPVSRQWNSFIGSVRALPNRAVVALDRLGTNLSAVASNAWQRFRDAAASKWNGFMGWLRGLPSQIAGGLSPLQGQLYAQGVNVVQGLWQGIQSMGGWIRSQIMGWAKSVIPGPIAKALGIASPSKVTKAQGKWIAQGLIDGLTGSSKQIKAAAEKVADIVTDALKPGRKRSTVLGKISSGSKQLLKLASQEEKLADKLKKASADLADLKKERDQLADSVKSGILSGASITGQSGSSSPEAILARLQRDRKAAEAFAASLAKLKKQGVRSDLIEQIAQAGVDQGAALAASLASATPAQVKAINAEQSKLAKAAGKAGSTAADAMYGAGIAAGEGLVKGLQKQQKAIEQQMLKIAKSMSASIRKALGIKSPSKVMARVGVYTAQGLVKGLEGERRAVDRTMAGLVATPSPADWATSRAEARAARERTVNNTTSHTYNMTMRQMTVRDLETLQRRQDARARVGRPR
ncbi:phage tail tape measure protein [Streptomyces shenzhenensis]|uniref:phage tail tape measure protein n=1 Tax=Streptomyces shenzhenensis TaxID=943815 RepID=UPI0034011C14